MSKFLDSLDGSRAAIVYWAVNTHPEIWRIRVERYPDYSDESAGNWFGGRVLWGHDKPTEEEALEVARAWVDRGELPEGVTP